MNQLFLLLAVFLRWESHRSSLYPLSFRSYISPFFFFFLAAPCSTWDLPQPGIKPTIPAVEEWILNHWTTAKSLGPTFQDLQVILLKRLSIRLEERVDTSILPALCQRQTASHSKKSFLELLPKIYSQGNRITMWLRNLSLSHDYSKRPQRSLVDDIYFISVL